MEDNIPQTPEVNTQETGTNYKPVPPLPEDHLIMAILITIFCCLPFGIIGIVKATQVSKLYYLGQYDAAQVVANDAKKWSMWGLWLGIAAYVLYSIFLIIVIATE